MTIREAMEGHAYLPFTEHDTRMLMRAWEAHQSALATRVTGSTWESVFAAVEAARQLIVDDRFAAPVEGRIEIGLDLDDAKRMLLTRDLEKKETR